MTVIEISPGSGYWTEILAPYAKATGGKYIATGAATPFQARLTNAAFGTPTFTGNFDMTSGPLAPAGSADIVLTARNIHNWLWVPGMIDKAMKDFHTALKPGGVLGDRRTPRRSAPRNRRQRPDGHDGYVSTKTVIEAATKAGFKLEAQSELNANPKDKKDHPGGVWMLPPTNARRVPGSRSTYNPETYKAIGESDRMTLRFRKPRRPSRRL